ncbi:hypothetical protein E3U43_011838 [Larimichthys crocea]|uniref:Uncharacterized protein n=1 Tax=Larimichthys crocea TaxID=215358 RepID=A0ACD3QKX6_LARCR|nr:hypothetical protein E3U43_011838 [Larimichthys crocea]
MEEVKEDGEGEPADRQSRPNQTPAVLQLLQTSWSQTLRTVRPWKGWYSFALVGVVWSVCQVEEPQHPSLFLTGVCWRLLLVCSLWIVLGGCAHVPEVLPEARTEPGGTVAEGAAGGYG